MHALHKALDAENGPGIVGNVGIVDGTGVGGGIGGGSLTGVGGQLPMALNGNTNPDAMAALAVARQMDLQRRGNGDGKMFWRCYFNAVSCF